MPFHINMVGAHKQFTFPANSVINPPRHKAHSIAQVHLHTWCDSIAPGFIAIYHHIHPERSIIISAKQSRKCLSHSLADVVHGDEASFSGLRAALQRAHALWQAGHCT